MRDMTTAEFAKANLATLDEPVKIRRYTKAVGTYYPEGYIASLPGEIAQTALEPTPPLPTAYTKKRFEELEEEIKHLKKQLAARPAAGPDRPEHPMKDVFSELAKQDREFFERKLGKAKPKRGHREEVSELEERYLHGDR